MSKRYKHLSREERYSIKEMRDIGLSINSISKKMNRSKGTISMEIKRNKVHNKYENSRTKLNKTYKFSAQISLGVL
jgi:IS30 family transposase